MAALWLSLQRCCRRTAHLVARRPYNSSPVAPAAPPTLRRSFLIFLTQRFYDIEMLLNWTSSFRIKRLQKDNSYYGYTSKFYGCNVAAGYYVLSLKGRFRYAGQSEWFYTDRRGKFNWDFVNYKDSLIEEVDLSRTVVNYMGLGNLEEQQSLRTLSLRGCPEVDDWSLTRLHMFQGSLEELDISHCPRITTGGLAALRHLKGLRRLDVSSLPRITNPGLLIILLEEMLPLCQIIATGYDHSLGQEDREEMEHMQGQR